MVRTVRILQALVLSGGVFLCGSALSQPADSGWAALHRLDIPAARALFAAHLKEHPGNASALRGLILTEHFDCRYDPQFQYLDALVKGGEVDPYLTGVLEHVAAELESFADKQKMVGRFGEAFQRSPDPMTQHYGRQVQRQCAWTAGEPVSADLLTGLGFPPGCWMSGPYENQSRIAAFRLLPLEDQPLDTGAVVVGKNGARVEWRYVPADNYGELHISTVVEDQEDFAGLLRFNFSIPTEQEVVILLGGAFHYRLRIDGTEVFEDKTFRNAVQREGVRATLSAGPHEITVALGYVEGMVTPFALSVLGGDFGPIEGLRWLREPVTRYAPAPTVSPFHPLFDPLARHIAAHGEEPDSRYWRSMLHIYNGYCREAIRELEDADAMGSLSLLELWLLKQALEMNNEGARAAECLRRISERAHCAKSDWAWIRAIETDNAAVIRRMEEMVSTYPDRLDYESMAMLMPLLNGDVSGFVARTDSLRAKYPKAGAIPVALSMLYQSALGDGEAALKTFLDYCRITGDRRSELFRGPLMYAGVKRYDEGIAAAREAIEVYGARDAEVAILAATCAAANRHLEAEPVLDSLIRLYPSNIDLATALHQIYTETSKFKEAREMLGLIHRYKPSAIQPYLKLDSLHNDTPYDSIFGSLDVMSYWDIEPSIEQLAGQGMWMLVDRDQVLVFESGVACVDRHWATVLVDQGAVESSQEYGIGFSSDDAWHSLLTARRLRKGQPPLAGEHQGTSVIFRDLKPGDAIEIRYRAWYGNSGDLWNEYWDTYLTGSNAYQRFWEYSVFTERSDVMVRALPPCPKAEETRVFGYKKTSWRQEHTQAVDLEAAALPPADEILGKIFVSTLDGWDQLDRWYYSISEAVLHDNVRAERRAADLVGPADTPKDKLRKLYESIVLEFPYQTISFDYDAAIPHTPDEVLVNRWGDCKDKGHLLICMLRSVGMEAWPVLVMTRSSGYSLPIPYFGFDHLIVGTVIDGDTLYVDPTRTPFDPEHSISDWIAGQPCLSVSGRGERLTKLPGPAPNSTDMKWGLSLVSRDDGQYSFAVNRQWRNLSAGWVREDYRDVTPQGSCRDKEAYFADAWGVTLKIDSLIFDSTRSVSPIFHDSWWGSMTLPSQHIGKTAVITLPRLCHFDKSLLTTLIGHTPRTQPVDLREFCGHHEYTVTVVPPAGLTRPQLLDPVQIEDSLMAMTYEYDWEEPTRTLTLKYTVSVRDGLIAADRFRNYIEKVIEVFESPLLFAGE